jgi:hypothetical protein
VPSDKELKAFYFLSGIRDPAICSYTWRIGTRSTSFYVKPLYKALAGFKVSLHGPDPRPTFVPGFRFGVDASASSISTSSGGAIVQRDLPNGERWFEGEDVEGIARLAMRFRVTSDLFDEGVPSAPPPTKNVKATAKGYVVPPPPVGYVNDVEIYVAPGGPYWPNETEARRNNACMGPIRNLAGEYLTGLSVRRSVDHPISPPEGMSQGSGPSHESIRAVSARLDNRQVLWILEEWMPKAFFETTGGD